MNIRILSSAYNDLKMGRKFYEKQVEGLGEYFFDSLFSDIDSLVLYGGIHLKMYGYHRLLSKQFPYAIYYKMDNKENVIVHRILDCRQESGKTRASLLKND